MPDSLFHAVVIPSVNAQGAAVIDREQRLDAAPPSLSRLNPEP